MTTLMHRASDRWRCHRLVSSWSTRHTCTPWVRVFQRQFWRSQGAPDKVASSPSPECDQELVAMDTVVFVSLQASMSLALASSIFPTLLSHKRTPNNYGPVSLPSTQGPGRSAPGMCNGAAIPTVLLSLCPSFCIFPGRLIWINLYYLNQHVGSQVAQLSKCVHRSVGPETNLFMSVWQVSHMLEAHSKLLV
ncbi:hypothetical protein EDB86DRAFT_603208 [Lactarius hatsudake]|nr:hypothetical protein EDB86DRAFT_603208 [Lactarius hatsudake]